MSARSLAEDRRPCLLKKAGTPVRNVFEPVAVFFSTSATERDIVPGSSFSVLTEILVSQVHTYPWEELTSGSIQTPSTQLNLSLFIYGDRLFRPNVLEVTLEIKYLNLNLGAKKKEIELTLISTRMPRMRDLKVVSETHTNT
jgi:hypothetical protein